MACNLRPIRYQKMRLGFAHSLARDGEKYDATTYKTNKNNQKKLYFNTIFDRYY